MKRMYSAVPGRVYVATRAHSASGDRELSLSKGDKVKGEEECENWNFKAHHLWTVTKRFQFTSNHIVGRTVS